MDVCRRWKTSRQKIEPALAMKLPGPLAAIAPALRFTFRLALALELFKVKRDCGTDKVLQSRLIHLLAFVDVDGTPDISIETGVE
jgi:hypothetical protein